MGLWGCFFNHFILINVFYWESYIFHAGQCVCCCFFFVLRKVGVSPHLEFDWSEKRVCRIIGRVQWLSQYLAEENIDNMFKPHRQHHIYVKKKKKKCVLFINVIYLFISRFHKTADIKLTVCFFIFLIYLKSIFLVHVLSIYF